MEIDEELVRRLVDEQFPQWRELSIRRVVPGGWDNRTFRLGDELLVRMPSADGYAADLAEFLTSLAKVETDAAPAAGLHSFWRGAHPRVYDDDVQRCLTELEGRIDTAAARAVWDAAMETEITAPPVWFHGDIAPGNLLVREGRLSAVIDFGTSGVGDPACDLAIAWTVFDDAAREVFRSRMPWDDDTWSRGRAWALWKTMLTLADPSNPHDPEAEARASLAVLDRVLA